MKVWQTLILFARFLLSSDSQDKDEMMRNRNNKKNGKKKWEKENVYLSFL